MDRHSRLAAAEREVKSSHLAASNDRAEARHALLLAFLEFERAILD